MFNVIVDTGKTKRTEASLHFVFYWDSEMDDIVIELTEAAGLIRAFLDHIETTCEGDHPMYEQALRWVERFEGEA